MHRGRSCIVPRPHGVADPLAQGSEPAHSLLQDPAACSSPLQPPLCPCQQLHHVKTQLMAAAVENQHLSLPMKEVIAALLPPGDPLFSKSGTEGMWVPKLHTFHISPSCSSPRSCSGDLCSPVSNSCCPSPRSPERFSLLSCWSPLHGVILSC